MLPFDFSTVVTEFSLSKRKSFLHFAYAPFGFPISHRPNWTPINVHESILTFTMPNLPINPEHWERFGFILFEMREREKERVSE